MNSRVVVGILGAVLLIASSWAHAFLGWPHFREILTKANVDADSIGSLAVGWHFGSVSMLTIGLIVLMAAIRVQQGKYAATEGIKVVAIAYIAFGGAAFYFRNFEPSFLMFVATGLLIGWFAFRRVG